MAYDTNKLSRVGHLKELAQRIAEDYATKKSVADLKEQVDGLVTAGGEPNKLEAVKVNGTALPITEKAVDVGASIASAVAAAAHLQRKKVASVDDIDPNAEDAEKFIYMVPKANAKGGDKYDEYMVLDGAVEKVGDWAVDLSGYQQKEEGKGLSSNDYTDEEKAKLAGLEIASDEEVAEMLAEVFGPAA